MACGTTSLCLLKTANYLRSFPDFSALNGIIESFSWNFMARNKAPKLTEPLSMHDRIFQCVDDAIPGFSDFFNRTRAVLASHLCRIYHRLDFGMLVSILRINIPGLVFRTWPKFSCYSFSESCEVCASASSMAELVFVPGRKILQPFNTSLNFCWYSYDNMIELDR